MRSITAWNSACSVAERRYDPCRDNPAARATSCMDVLRYPKRRNTS